MVQSVQISFSEFLKERRLKLKMTQSEAAKRAGYRSRQHIHNIESGQSFSMELGIRLAKVYGINKKTVKDFLCDTSTTHIDMLVEGIYRYE